MSEDWRPLLRKLQCDTMDLDIAMEREAIRYAMIEIHRIAGHISLLIDQEIIRELKDLRRAMPEHGFTTEPRQKYTIDDIL